MGNCRSNVVKCKGRIRVGFKLLQKIIDKIRKKNTWSEHFEYNPDMKLRYENMLDLLDKEFSSVLDLGCGCQYLLDILHERNSGGGVEYLGLDLHRHKESTVVCDFNKKEFPVNKQYDLVVVAGLLEYIYNKNWFLKNVMQRCNKYLLMSYNFKEYAKSVATIWTPLSSQLDVFTILLKDQQFTLRKVVPDPVNPEPNTTLYMLFERRQ